MIVSPGIGSATITEYTYVTTEHLNERMTMRGRRRQRR